MNEDKELDMTFKEYEELRSSISVREAMIDHVLMHVAMEVTKKCNARCEHCSVNAEAKIEDEELTTEQWKKVFRDLADRYEPCTLSIGFTGGEPLIRPDFIEIAEYARDLGFNMTVTTNGVLLTDKMIERLYNASVRIVTISIDGLQETHENFRKLPGCYPRLLKSIEKMNEHGGFDVGITTVVTKKSIDELEALYKQFVDLKINFWRLFIIDPGGRALEAKDIYLNKEEYERVFDFIEEKQREGKINISYGCNHFLGFEREKQVRGPECYECHTGINIGTVLNNGDIFGCSNIPRRPELIQGNVKTDNFVDVWENRFEIYRNPERLANKKCKNCKYWRYCRGDAMHTFDFDNKEPIICMKDILGFE